MADRSVIVHLRGNSGDGAEVSRRLHEAGLTVREFGDPYATMGFLARMRGRAAALVINLSALDGEEWELVGLARRFVPAGAVCGYARAAAVLRGPSSISIPSYPSDQPQQLDAMMSHLRARAGDPSRQNGKRTAAGEVAVSGEAETPRAAAQGGAPGQPTASESAGARTLSGAGATAGSSLPPPVEPAPQANVSIECGEAGGPSAMSEGEGEGVVPFPWSPARDLPRRRPPRAAPDTGGATPQQAHGADADEPILTPAELRALLGEE